MHPPVLDTWPLTQYTDYGPRPVESSPNHAGIDYGPKSGIRSKVYAPFTGYLSRIVRGRAHGDTSTVNSIRPGVTGNGPTITNDGDGKGGYLTALMGHVDVLDSLGVGDRVSEGQHIGFTDLSGNTSGHHVHFELHTGQSARSTTHFNPLPTMKAAGAEPGREWDDMPTMEEIDASLDARVGRVKDLGKEWPHKKGLENLLTLVRRQGVQLESLTEVVRTLATSQGADPDAIVAAVTEAVEKKLSSMTVEFN